MLSWNIRKIKGRPSAGPQGDLGPHFSAISAHTDALGMALKRRVPGRLPRGSGVSIWKNLQGDLGQGVPPGKTLRNTSSEGEEDSSRSCTGPRDEAQLHPSERAGAGALPCPPDTGSPTTKVSALPHRLPERTAHLWKVILTPVLQGDLPSFSIEERESAVTSPRAPGTLLRLTHTLFTTSLHLPIRGPNRTRHCPKVLPTSGDYCPLMGRCPSPGARPPVSPCMLS